MFSQIVQATVKIFGWKLYLEDLNSWKNKLLNTENSKKTLYIVAEDVQGLYLNLCRKLIKASLFNALQICTSYTKKVREILIDLTFFA